MFISSKKKKPHHGHKRNTLFMGHGYAVVVQLLYLGFSDVLYKTSPLLHALILFALSEFFFHETLFCHGAAFTILLGMWEMLPTAAA